MNPPHFSSYMRLQTLFLFRSLAKMAEQASGISDPARVISVLDLGLANYG